MKVFVTGATGAIGVPALRQVVAAGHEVKAVARGETKAGLVRSLGGQPVEVDLFDARAVHDAVKGVDAIVHLATNIPPATKAARTKSWATNDRLRREATRHLVDAALAHGIDRIVKESISFVYPDLGELWIDESTRVVDTPLQASTFESERTARKVTEAGGTCVVLRFGMFYGPATNTTDEALRFARFRLAWPVLGDGAQRHPAVHTDDAASAVVAALTAPAGTYHVAGDPPTKREFADAFSAAFDLPRLKLAPARLVRVGGAKLDFALRSQRISSELFRTTTGWVPAHPNIDEGWRSVAAARSGGVNV
jgi:nucleoside-diphosphate-sugar epimerase